MQKEKLKCNNYSDDFIFYVKFDSLTDMYYYLSDNKKVKKILNKGNGCATPGVSRFHGKPFPEALKMLKGRYAEGLEDFLKTNELLKKTITEVNNDRKVVTSVCGGVPIVPLAIAGVPKCMLQYEPNNSSVVRDIYFDLGYSGDNDSKQVFNRGIATLHIIQALEARGEIINFHAFSLAEGYGGYVMVEVTLKKPEEYFLDIGKCYFPLTQVEFERRLAWMVYDLCDTGWDDYGKVVDERVARKMFNFKKNSLYIPQPSTMHLDGYDEFEDCIKVIKYLNLEDEFDIDKIRELKNVKTLTKRR